MLKQIQSAWRMEFNDTVEDITVFDRWEEQEHPATMMMVERFDQDLLVRMKQLLEEHDIFQLVALVRFTLHTVLSMAAEGVTITDMTLSNLCLHEDTVRVADWGCGKLNASVSACRTAFKRRVQCVAPLVSDHCDLGPLQEVYSYNQGSTLVTHELRQAIDSLRPVHPDGSVMLLDEYNADSTTSSAIDRWFYGPRVPPSGRDDDIPLPMGTGGAAVESIGDGEWTYGIRWELRDSPPITAARCPLGLAVGGGGAPRVTLTPCTTSGTAGVQCTTHSCC